MKYTRLIITIVIAMTCWYLPAQAKSGAKKELKINTLEGPKMAEEEYHARLEPISIPGLRKGAAAHKGRNVVFKLIIVTEDEDNLETICQMAAAYRDALLIDFHETPVVLDRRSNPYDMAVTSQRIVGILRNTLGNELVTGIRLASENVIEYAEKSIPCGR